MSAVGSADSPSPATGMAVAADASCYIILLKAKSNATAAAIPKLGHDSAKARTSTPAPFSGCCRPPRPGWARSAISTKTAFVFALIVAISLEFCSPLEELHDLGRDEHRDGAIGIGDADDSLSNDVSQESDKTSDHPHRTMLEQEDYARYNNGNFIERFSRAISNEIMRRLPTMEMKMPFRFQPPWRDEIMRWQNSQQKQLEADPLKDEGFSDGSSHHGKGSTKSIDIQTERRVGAWCHPESLEDHTAGDDDVDINLIDKYVVTCNPDPLKSLESPDGCRNDGALSINDVQPGMVVFVFPQGKLDAEQRNPHPDAESATSLERINPHANTLSDAGINDGSIKGTRCLLEMGQRYDNDEQVVQYTLLQQEPIELGNVDVHRKDFAYQPVALTIDDGRNRGSDMHGGDTSHGHGLQARIKPQMKVLETISPLPSHRPSPCSAHDDQQVSFRWWSWVSQLLHHVKKYGGNDAVKGIVSPDVVISDSSQQDHDQYHGQHSSYRSNIYEESGRHPFAGGSHGEIWRARRRCPTNAQSRVTKARAPSTQNKTTHLQCDDGKDLIVKRLKIEYGYAVLEAGLREVYFGELLAREVESSNLFTTYVDHFFREGSHSQIELWVVFENAGPSLRSFLYTPVETAGGFVLFQHSAFWRRLRRSIAGDKDEALVPILHTNVAQKPDHKYKGQHEGSAKGSRNAPEGRALLREVLKQIITAVAFLHERGIVHRDVKPSNVMCKTTPPTQEGIIPHRIEYVRCFLGDFSSAWDEFSNRNLYANGPSSKEQTDEYAPPEVLFQGSSWSPFFHENPFSYDSWSIGVVALEMLLGTPNVFSVDQRTTSLLTNRLTKEGASSHDIQRALYLAALSQFCIYVPTEMKNWPLRRGDPLHSVTIVKDKCTIKDFHSALRARDPLGFGFDDDANVLLHLVWRLLDWDPLERLSPSEALKHPYFAMQSLRDHRHWNPNFSHNKLFSDTVVVQATEQNALEHQTLDPRVDIAPDTATISEFICPKCGKRFADHNSCQKHARARRHARFCTYDRTLLPQCMNAHSLLPTHPSSGYCDIQGRRATIEDFHTVHLNPGHQFYGVFDGHLGNLASKYAASSFYSEVEECLSNVDESIISSQSNWKEDAASTLVQSFKELHSGIISAVTSSPGGVMDESGTTATILYVTELAVIVANVGDSRAIMSQWLSDDKGNQIVTAMQLTVDHIASSEDERKQILARGGYVTESSGISRINGSLAVSRSLGDIKLAPFLSRTPHTLALTKEEAHAKCGKIQSNEDQHLACFIILASDGLWDVMSNQEAVDLAWQVIKGDQSGTAFQEAAEVLTQEAYVRGSSDNIGVCVVAIM